MERVFLHLGWMDTDYAIRKNESNPIIETITIEAISLYESVRGPIASLQCS